MDLRQLTRAVKLNKTQTAIMASLKRHRGFYSVQSGLHRGRGGTGKLRPYGQRERDAAHKLVQMGLVEVVTREHGTTYNRGYGCPWYIIGLKAIEPASVIIAE